MRTDFQVYRLNHITCISENIRGTEANAEKVKERRLSQVHAHGNQASIGAFEGIQKASCLSADQRREGDSSQEEKLTVDVSFIFWFCCNLAVYVSLENVL